MFDLDISFFILNMWITIKYVILIVVMSNM